MKLAFLTIPVLGLFGWSDGPASKSSNSPSLPECEVAGDWAKSYYWMLPTTVDNLTAYPVLYQRAIFDNSKQATRIALWREHLQRFYGPGSRLSVSQQSFVRAVSEDLDRIFAGPASNDWLTQFGDGAIAVLGRHAAIAIFGNLGAEDPELLDLTVVGTGDPASRWSQLRRKPTHDVFLAATSNYRSYPSSASSLSQLGCHCNRTSDFCDTITGPREECQAIACAPTETGCGWFWLQDCNGRCNYVSPEPPPT